MKDEYEVELKDYLLVAWQRRWLIVVVLLIAVGSVGIYSFAQTDIYRATALLQWKVPPIAWEYRHPTFEAFAASELKPIDPAIKVDESVTILEAGRISGSSRVVVTATSDQLVRVVVEGALEPQILAARVSDFIADRVQVMSDMASREYQDVVSSYTRALEFYEQERADLFSKMRDQLLLREEKLRTERESLNVQVDSLITSGFGSATDGNTQAQNEKRLSVLLGQLQAVEMELISLSAAQESQFMQPGLGLDLQVNDLNRRITNIKIVIQEYERLGNANWSPLQLVDEVIVSSRPIGPARGLNLVVAAIAGLLLGLISAFIVSYLQELETPSKA